MRIAVTDASYKHAMALAHYLRRFDPSFKVTGITRSLPRFSSLYSGVYDQLLVADLKDLLEMDSFDLIIPVGDASVKLLSDLECKQAILPPKESLAIALSKRESMKLAESLGIPAPKTYPFQSAEELKSYSGPFPVVVKASLEAGRNIVHYVDDLENLKKAYLSVQNDPSQKMAPPLVQELVQGAGLGFFAFYQSGELKRFYMHRRIREYPLTGGSATAAKTYYHQKAFDAGKKLLDTLQWNGPCMVEFKHDEKTDEIKLIEINPKLWGSLELGLAAGLNFGEYLVRAFRGEELHPQLQKSYPDLHFYWPFEGDLFGIFAGANFSCLADYFQKGYQTNIKTNGMTLSFLRLAADIKRKLR
ncbi:ATP-grasp domain-containing protein [Estrella lausannensis]|uniref:ATP-grasp domain-containing protein n=1 Tax=Estrella lausannensis TaxID=483423 RepID=A0A0H5E667_9BACT|nr:hypothetical protein [Estrella lausannensis]CRX38760.1 hypothetical protein ELAC_1424 [Estrella lausannensis]